MELILTSFRVLVEEASEIFETIVCAPDGERSWIGHAISRHAKLRAQEEKRVSLHMYTH